MGITLRNGVDEMDVKTVDEIGTDKMGSYHAFMEKYCIYLNP